MRLTKKNDYGYMLEIKGVDTSFGQNAIIIGDTANKLGQLEDIEEELGIDLLTLFKAIENGIWVKIGKKRIVKDEPDGLTKCALENGFQYIKRDGWRLDCIHGLIETKDYGKTWALTKEELL